MRKWVVVLLAAAMVVPARAAKTVSVQDLEDLLATLHGKPDAKVAQQLSELQVTERISFARLTRWEKDFPGEHTREELTKLAGLTAFLKPPAIDVLRDPEPDADTQEHMLSLAGSYVKTTLTRLPNFYATRETTHFEDTPSQETGPGSGGGQAGTGWRAMRTEIMEMGKTDNRALHSTGTSSAMVTYRDGYEVDDENVGNSGKPSPPPGLSTRGEFGPILSIVLGDALRSNNVTWLRWEQGPNEPVAVLGYRIPEDQSNYVVMIPNGTRLDRTYSAYHGEIAIDPEAGQILRVSVVADLPPPHESMQTAMVVEYGAVMIGDQSYICPVWGVAYSKVPAEKAPGEPQGAAATVQTEINDVAFTNYHLFRSDARIVANDNRKSAAPPADPAPAKSPGSGSKPN